MSNPCSITAVPLHHYEQKRIALCCHSLLADSLINSKTNVNMWFHTFTVNVHHCHWLTDWATDISSIPFHSIRFGSVSSVIGSVQFRSIPLHYIPYIFSFSEFQSSVLVSFSFLVSLFHCFTNKNFSAATWRNYHMGNMGRAKSKNSGST